VIYKNGEPWQNGTDREKRKKSEIDLSQYQFVHQNSTWTDLGANPGLHGERPATNRLRHGMT
jgi:hypothetical protein